MLNIPTIEGDRPATPNPFEDDDIEDDFLKVVFGSQMSTAYINVRSELEI